MRHNLKVKTVLTTPLHMCREKSYDTNMKNGIVKYRAECMCAIFLYTLWLHLIALWCHYKMVELNTIKAKFCV